MSGHRSYLLVARDTRGIHLLFIQATVTILTSDHSRVGDITQSETTILLTVMSGAIRSLGEAASSDFLVFISRHPIISGYYRILFEQSRARDFDQFALAISIVVTVLSELGEKLTAILNLLMVLLNISSGSKGLVSPMILLVVI